MTILAEYKLGTEIDSAKSFYGKATVQEIDYADSTIIKLTSYGTHVASIIIDEDGRRAEVYGTYSATTLRHIKDFLYQNGFPIGTKSFIEEKYIVEGGN